MSSIKFDSVQLASIELADEVQYCIDFTVN